MASQNTFFIFVMLFACSCKRHKTTQPIVVETSATHFVTLYESFDQVDTSRWEHSLYSFLGNACNMRKENVGIKDSKLQLKAEVNKSEDFPLPYHAGGLSDKQFHLFGYYTIKMKVPACPGTVSGVFLMNEFQLVDWQHKGIDTEFPGNSATSFQCTTLENYKAGNPNTYSSKFYPLAFNSSDHFHEYSILWTPDSVSWFVDQQYVASTKKYVPQVPLQIVLLHYVGDANLPGYVQWLGAIRDSSLPAMLEVDWIKFETLVEYASRLKMKQ